MVQLHKWDNKLYLIIAAYLARNTFEIWKIQRGRLIARRKITPKYNIWINSIKPYGSKIWYSGSGNFIMVESLDDKQSLDEIEK